MVNAHPDEVPDPGASVVMDATRRYSNLDTSLEHARKLAKKTGRNRQVERLNPTAKAHRVAQRLDGATIQQLVADYRDGVPTTRLTTKYGLAKGTVSKLLREHGATVRSNRRPT
jgi:hypothetical protein